MHIFKNYKQTKIALFLITTSITIIIFTFAIIAPSFKNKFQGTVLSFKDNNRDTILCLWNYPTENNYPKKSTVIIYDSLGNTFPGYPIFFDNKLLPNACTGTYNGEQIICVIENTENNKFYVHLLDIYGGEFSSAWPVVVNSTYCSTPKISYYNNEPLIVFNTDNKIHILNVYGYLNNFPADIPVGEEKLNSGVAILNGGDSPLISVATDKGSIFFTDISGNVIKKVSTGQGSEQEIISDENNIFRAYSGGIQNVNPTGDYKNITVPEGTYSITQPISIMDDKMCFLDNQKSISIYDQKGQKVKFPAPSNFSNSFSAPLIENIDNDNYQEIVFPYDNGLGNWKITGFEYPSGSYAPGCPFSVPDEISSQPAIADINDDLRKDLIFACSDGTTYYAPTYRADPDAGEWIMPTELEIYTLASVPDLFIFLNQKDIDIPCPWAGQGLTPEVDYSIKSDELSGVLGWQIYDGKGDISFDKNEGAVKLTGNKTSTGYRLRKQTEQNSFADWNETILKGISFTLKYAETFVVYVSVDTDKGPRYIYYTDTELDDGLNFNGDYIHLGLGKKASDGNWHRFARNLEQDLRQYEPDNHITKIYAFLIRGSGLVRNVFLYNPSKTLYETETDSKINNTRRDITWEKDGKNKIKRYKNYYIGAVTSEIVYIYDENNRLSEYQTNTYVDNKPVYTSKVIYCVDVKYPDGSKDVKTITINYYLKENGGVSYLESTSKYDPKNILISNLQETSECDVTTDENGKYICKKGRYMYCVFTEYVYSDPVNATRITKSISTKKDTAGNIIDVQTYYDKKYDLSGRLIYQALKSEVPCPDLTATAITEYTYIFGDKYTKYVYKYLNGDGNWLRTYSYAYNQLSQLIEAKYDYPSYTQIYSQYKYNEFNKPTYYNIATTRFNNTTSNTDSYVFYNNYGDTDTSINITNNSASLSKNIYDEYRRSSKTATIGMSKDSALSLINSGALIDYDNFIKLQGESLTISTILERILNTNKKVLNEYFYGNEGKYYYLNKRIDTYEYDELYRRIYVDYEYFNRLDKKYLEYQYHYDSLGRYIFYDSISFNMARINYLTYRYEYTYKNNSQKTDSIRYITYRGDPSDIGNKTAESVVAYDNYDPNGNLLHAKQFTYNIKNGNITLLNDIFYTYKNNYTKRSVQFKYKVLDDIKSHSEDIKDKELLQIFEQRNLEWDNLNNLVKYQELAWGPDYLDNIKATEPDCAEAKSYRNVTSVFDEFSRRISLVYQDCKYNNPYWTQYTYNYNSDGSLKDYRYEYQHNNDNYYKNTYLYEYNNKGLLIKVKNAYGYIDGYTNYQDVTYEYDDNSTTAKTSTISSNDLSGKMTLISKTDVYPKYNYSTNYLSSQETQYFVNTGSEWVLTYKMQDSNFRYDNTLTLGYTSTYYNPSGNILYTTDYDRSYDELARPVKYTYTNKYPSCNAKNYIYKYEYVYNPENSLLKQVNYLYLTLTGKEIKKYVYTYLYDELNFLSKRDYAFYYPDKDTPIWLYKYEYFYDNSARNNKTIEKYFRDDKLYSEAEYYYNTKLNRLIKEIYKQTSTNLITKYYDFVYDIYGTYYRYKYEKYKDTLADTAKISSGLNIDTYNNKHQLISRENKNYNSKGDLINTLKYNYDPEQGFLLSYKKTNELTGGYYDIKIKEWDLTSNKKIEKVVSNSPPLTYFINYTLDESGRTLNTYTEIKNTDNKLIRIEKEDYDPISGFITRWEKKYVSEDGFMNEQRLCTNINYSEARMVTNEVVSVKDKDNNAYMLSVTWEYDDIYQHVSNLVTSSKGNNWREILDPVTGNMLYKINLDTGDKEDPNSPPSSGPSPCPPSTEENNNDIIVSNKTPTSITQTSDIQQTPIANSTESAQNNSSANNIYAAGVIVLRKDTDEPSNNSPLNINSEQQIASAASGGVKIDNTKEATKPSSEEEYQNTELQLEQPLELHELSQDILFKEAGPQLPNNVVQPRMPINIIPESKKAIAMKYDPKDWLYKLLRNLIYKFVSWGRQTASDIPHKLDSIEAMLGNHQKENR